MQSSKVSVLFVWLIPMDTIIDHVMYPWYNMVVVVKNKSSESLGRNMVPSPDVHRPAIARNKLLLPTPDGPTINKCCPFVIVTFKLCIKVRFISGVLKVKFSICNASFGSTHRCTLITPSG